MRIFSLIIVFAYVTSEIDSVPLSDSENLETSRVHIKHITRRKRSVDSDNHFIDLEFEAFDTTHKLQLRSPKSLFTDGFEYHDVDVDLDGNVVHTERTPSKREIHAIEQNIYVDHEANAVLRLEDVDGELQMGGLVGSLRISRDAMKEEHLATNESESDPVPDHNKADYIDTKRPIATARGIPTGKVSVSPEVCFVIDYENGKFFNFDEAKILDYVAIMLNAVNNRYATVADPQITFKVSGIHVLKSKAAQPFVEQSKNSEGKIIIEKLLEAFALWVRSSMKNKKQHDLFPLLYGNPPLDQTVGLAFLDGVCSADSSPQGDLGTSVNYDAGGSWQGALTVAHELAHNLGAPHDGENDPTNPRKNTDSCPWKGGYIMSYLGYGTLNKFTFSPCSTSLMKEYIQSSGGHCLFTANTPNPPPPKKGDIGDRITMEEMCKKRVNATATLKSKDPNEQCLLLVCQTTEEKKFPGGRTMTSFKWRTFSELPGDNSPCGTGGGRCKNGKCVVGSG